jgi:predicted  nucleic acid-binding Zn-ribbon protein
VCIVYPTLSFDLIPPVSARRRGNHIALGVLSVAIVKEVELLQAERDGLSRARQELERKLETKDLELHEKEEELFLQLEKVVRLEEDVEKVSTGLFSSNTFFISCLFNLCLVHIIP